VLDVAAIPGSSWVLRRDGLFVIRPDHPVKRLVLPTPLADPQLVADPDAGLVWLVANGLARSYSGGTLHTVFQGWAPPCDGATAMLGRLFVTVDRYVVEVGPGLRVPFHVATMPGPIVAVTADPTRVRLILAYLARQSRVVALSQRPDGRGVVEEGAVLHVNQPTLAVAGGNIWLAGYSGGDALARLDPHTLRPVGLSSAESALGLGAYLAAAGASTVWVRGAGDDGELRCLDAATGRQLQSWVVSGRVAAAAPSALVGTINGAVELELARCKG
jgi:outer membrane protein assembly factor BamB